MSSRGNIHLRRNPELENALVRMKEGPDGGADLSVLRSALADLKEAFEEQALSARGEDAMRALGAMGAFRMVLGIIDDADGREPAKPDGGEERPALEDGE